MQAIPIKAPFNLLHALICYHKEKVYAFLSVCPGDPLPLLQCKMSMKVPALDHVRDEILFAVHCLKEQRQTQIHS